MPWTRAVLLMLKAVRKGELHIQTPNGQLHIINGKEPGPKADITLWSDAVCRRLLLGGDLRFGEDYMDGTWETTDLSTLLAFGAANRTALAKAIDGTRFGRFMKTLRHLSNRNTKRGSRRNIAHHYDIGNSFYGKWLDRA